MPRYLLFFPLLFLWMTSHAQISVADTTCKKLRSVFITGNKVTKKQIIMRELTFQRGDTLCPTQLDAELEQSQQNLFNTSLFNFVTIRPMNYDSVNPADSLIIDLLITVEERWYTWPSPVFEIQEPNFNQWWKERNFRRANYGVYLLRQNFRGRDEDLILNAQLGYTHRYALKYGVPYINKKQKLGAALTLIYKENDEVIYGTEGNERLFYNEDGLGNIREEFSGKLQFLLRPSYYTTHTFEGRFNYGMVNDSVMARRPDYFAGGNNSTRFVSLIYALEHDRRDIRYYPTKGYLVKLIFEKNGLGIVDKEGLNILHTIAAFKKYGQLSDRWFWGAGVSGKALLTPSIPYYHQEGFGYSEYVRGYELYVIDGQHWAQAKSNLKYRLIHPNTMHLNFIPMEKFNHIPYSAYINVFADAGHVWDNYYAENNELSNQWLYGMGVGIDFVTYYDKVLRLEYTWNHLLEHGFFIHFSQPI